MATESPGRCAFLFIIVASTIPILVTGYFLIRTLLFLRKGDPKCDHPHLEWDLWFGIFLLLVFLAGSIGVLLKVKSIQITCMILLVLTFFFIIVINLSIEVGGTFDRDTKRIDDDYRLETYAHWAQRFLLEDSGWNTYRNCLVERNICDKVDKKDSLQGGCCVPPPYCGYEDKNRTWVVPKAGRYADDVNCVRWDSERRKLCYDCETCQAVYIDTIVSNWGHRAMGVNLGALVLILCFFFTFEDDYGRRQNLNARVAPLNEI